MARALLLLACLGGASAQVPSVPGSWVAKETLTLIAQGQQKSQSGTHYYDLKFNRTRFDAEDGSIGVNLYYPEYKQMDVDKSTMQCVKYCSLCEEGLCDDLPPLIDENATDAGPLLLLGRQFQIAQTREKIFGVLTLETDSVYVDMSNASAPTPVAEQDVIKPPFFPAEMKVYADTEWTDFRAKDFAQEEAAFAVKGVDTCKKASALECNGGLQQLRRVRDKAFRTYAHHLKPIKAAPVQI